MKKCSKCCINKQLSEFSFSKREKDGKQDKCKSCDSIYYIENKERILNRIRNRSEDKEEFVRSSNNVSARKYRSKNKLKRTILASERRSRSVAWADKEKIETIYQIADIYRKAGFPCHVDHIIPIKGKTVCGLHVHENLNIIPAKENFRKGNRWKTISST